MAEHTPTPWVQFTIDGKCDAIMPSGRNGDICTFRDSPNEANAAFIIKAVNNHDALMTALEEILSAEKEFREGMPLGWEGDPLTDACKQARDALAKAST